MANHKSRSWHILVVVSVTLISLCALCASVNAGVSPNAGRNINPGDSVVIGETNLSFFNATGVFISEGVLLSDWADSHVVIPFNGFFDSSRYEDELLPGPYVIKVVASDESAITFVSPKLTITTEVNGEEFGWVTRGGEITFNADTNMWIITGSQPNYITYKLLDPRGKQVSGVNGVSLSDINVSATGLNTSTINTTGMRIGTYTLSIETDPNTNNGLDTEGPEVSFEVRTNGVTIGTTDTGKKTVTEDIVFAISTTPHTNITVNVTWGRESKVTFDAGGTFDLGPSDATGAFNTSATFADSGDYEITATEDIRGTTDSIYVEIASYEAELEADEIIYHIGKNVEITGSATAGDSITLKIDDAVVATGLAVEGFDYTWDTENLAPDSYKIAIWVLPFSDPFQDPPDASTYLVLIRGGLFVETSVDFVALGDDFKIEGTVPGRDRVDILTIAPDGGGGKGFDPDDIYEETNHKLTASGLTYATSGVDSDGGFETEEIAVGENVDTGTYLIAALNYGRDVEWGNSNNDTLLYVISNDYTTALGAKTTDQLLAMSKDKTINAAGTDDLLGITTLKVEKGFVTLDELENVPLGEDITITGTTNRKEDTPIIITVEGLDETTPKLKPKVAEVTEDDGRFYNTFEVSFDTVSTNIGKYEVTADDGEGHISSTMVNILPAEEPSVKVSTTPTPETEEGEESETKTEEGAKKPTTSTPAQAPEETEEQPGFELIFSIFGLLIAVAVLWQKQKKNER
jgi:hypothetical protein